MNDKSLNRRLEKIITIENEILLIIEEYSKTPFPKRYISDDRYRELKKELKDHNEYLESLKVIKNPESKIKGQKDTSNFDNFSDNVRKIITESGYDLTTDKENIINFHHNTNGNELADKVLDTRLEEFKYKHNL